jgi:hypothetical protein
MAIPKLLPGNIPAPFDVQTTTFSTTSSGGMFVTRGKK